MASILSDIGTNVGGELKTLDARLSSAETAIVNLGGQDPPPTGNLTIAPVVWTNLTEISFEPPTETGYALVAIGTAQAYIKIAGFYNGNNFSLGEILDIADYNPQNQSYKLQKKDGSLGFYWRVIGDATWGLGAQPISSGGSVQVNGNGGIEKISGSGGFNTGASSTNFIEGNSNGYVQFQWGSANKSLQVGLTYLDDDYGNVEPFRLTINGNGHVYTNGNNIFGGGAGWASQGDYFRIRHYASDNSIRFQRREEIFQDDADFCLLSSCGLSPNNGSLANHTFDEDSRPLILAKQDTSLGLVQGQYYKIYVVNTGNQASKIYDLDGTLVDWVGGGKRGVDWEVQESIGQDYVTFHTHSELTNGNNLYVDTSLFHVGSRLNDVLLAR